MIELLDVDAHTGHHLAPIRDALQRRHPVSVRRWTDAPLASAPVAMLAFPSASPGAAARAARFLARAAYGGIASNYSSRDARWGFKDQLEQRLCAHERAGGERVPRPATIVVPALAAQLAVDSLRARGCGAVIKPSNGARGEGIVIGQAPVSRAADPVVVQELVESPLVVASRKIDVRCYVVVVPGDPARSRRIGPILIRIASALYRRGEPAAEITNTAMRARLGMKPAIAPLENVAELSRRAEELRARVDSTVQGLLAACHAVSRIGRRRAMLWGLDVAVAHHDSRIWAGLLEVNVYPRLFRGEPTSDASVAHMLADDYLPELLASSAASASASSVAAR